MDRENNDEYRKTFSLANYILRYFQSKNEEIRNMKLQKLMYFCCGWNISVNGGDWLIDTDFKAWPYGPVNPPVYREVSSFESRPITKLIDNDDTGFTDNQKKVIDAVLGNYRQYSDWQLSDITHKDKTPWTETINRHHIGHEIARELIKEHYDGLCK